ncbi:hypothetical protein TpMuguga_01g00564 [Theileria parva strain Muguga]|uniref:EF-hand domain-containing protein n=1 Tax=Theileria parva TaxID=5875 RepID=Q4N8A8_THEPA|nr:uncharacterized protein TpMuguga_01g00564 [Theileria parva strain Muguga]EAN33800.1 hypothetical protein TpMuguga_01g00564 [Theileria parva strain Muguga]|eukprot:XP_766083.1 hypothetical protein [Theileria parva strain Muguga]
MECLRPLRNSELMYIFKSLTPGNLITAEDLSKLFKNLYNLQYSTQELQFTLTHLHNIANYNTVNSVNNVNTVNNVNNVAGIDFMTFVDGVNGLIKSSPVELILRDVFENISRDKSSVTVEDLLEFAEKSGIKLSEDSKLRLNSRLPQGKANFQQFIQCIQSS